MPTDTWGAPPAVQSHGAGFSIPVAVVETQVPATDDMPAYSTWTGIRVEVRSLMPVDVIAGVKSDPDATDDNLTEALALALEQTAQTMPAQVSALTDAVTALTLQSLGG